MSDAAIERYFDEMKGKTWQQAYLDAATERDEARAEFDRLRAMLGDVTQTAQEDAARLDKLETENEALREAGEGLAKRVESELQLIARWAGEQNAGNAFAEQVRLWALSKLARLARWREVAGDRDDVGPPLPGEGDHLPNPEAEMEC